LTGPSGREDLHPKEVRSPSQNGRQKKRKKRRKKEKEKKGEFGEEDPRKRAACQRAKEARR
jgi:hypothetical protein